MFRIFLLTTILNKSPITIRGIILWGVLRFFESQQILNIAYNKKDITMSFYATLHKVKIITGMNVPSGRMRYKKKNLVFYIVRFVVRKQMILKTDANYYSNYFLHTFYLGLNIVTKISLFASNTYFMLLETYITVSFKFTLLKMSFLLWTKKNCRIEFMSNKAFHIIFSNMELCNIIDVN
jgi:hypothetical protein